MHLGFTYDFHSSGFRKLGQQCSAGPGVPEVVEWWLLLWKWKSWVICLFTQMVNLRLTFIAGCVDDCCSSWYSSTESVRGTASFGAAKRPWPLRRTAGSWLALVPSSAPQLRSTNVRDAATEVSSAMSVIRQQSWDVWVHATWCQTDYMPRSYVYWVPQTTHRNQTAISRLDRLSFRLVYLLLFTFSSFLVDTSMIISFSRECEHPGNNH